MVLSLGFSNAAEPKKLNPEDRAVLSEAMASALELQAQFLQAQVQFQQFQEKVKAAVEAYNAKLSELQKKYDASGCTPVKGEWSCPKPEEKK